MTSHMDGECLVKDLFEYIEDHDLPYEICENEEAYNLAERIGCRYPYAPHTLSDIKYYGDFDGEEITCFLTVGGERGMVFAIYGTVDDATSTADCMPSYDLNDRAVRVQ